MEEDTNVSENVVEEKPVSSTESTDLETKSGEEAPALPVNTKEEYMLPKDVVHEFKCKRCSCRVFQPCVHILILDAKKSEELGYPLPSDPNDPLNSGPYRFLRQDAGLYVCVACGKRYRSEELVMLCIKDKAEAELGKVQEEQVKVE